MLALPLSEAILAQPGGGTPASPTGYRVDPAREYEVRWVQPPGIAGHCLARLTSNEEAIVLELTDFEVTWDDDDVRWRPVFVVAADGVADLEAVAAYGAAPIG